MYARVLSAWLLIATVSGCAGVVVMTSGCDIGAICSIEGELSIESKWQASVDRPNDCFALVVPEVFYTTQKHLDGRRAIVRGETFNQPTAEPGMVLSAYVVEEMRVNANLCAAAILVDEIVVSNGSIWRRSR